MSKLVITHNDIQYDLRTMDRQGLLLLKTELQETFDRIKGQLDQARSEQAAYGLYSDPDWYRKAQAAKRFTGSDMQKVQFVLSQRKKQEREKRANDLPNVFMDAAREMLPRELFYEVLTCARERRDFNE